MKKQENTKQKLFEMVNKLEPNFKLNEDAGYEAGEYYSGKMAEELIAIVDKYEKIDGYGIAPQFIAWAIEEFLRDDKTKQYLPKK